MIADTTFLSDFHDDHERKVFGPARQFMAGHRNQPLRITVISVGEIAVIFETILRRPCIFKPVLYR